MFYAFIQRIKEVLIYWGGGGINFTYRVVLSASHFHKIQTFFTNTRIMLFNLPFKQRAKSPATTPYTDIQIYQFLAEAIYLSRYR